MLTVKIPKPKWSKEIPEETGWYWIEFCDKHRQRIRRPATVDRTGKEAVVACESGVFTEETRRSSGFATLKFGPQIPFPV